MEQREQECVRRINCWSGARPYRASVEWSEVLSGRRADDVIEELRHKNERRSVYYDVRLGLRPTSNASQSLLYRRRDRADSVDRLTQVLS